MDDSTYQHNAGFAAIEETWMNLLQNPHLASTNILPRSVVSSIHLEILEQMI